MFFIRDNYLFNKYFKTTYIASFFHLAVYTYLFILTPYLVSLNWTEGQIGLFFALFSAVGIIVSPVVGSLSDAFGRFNIIIIGLFLCLIELLGYIFLAYPIPILILRTLGAIGFYSISIGSISRINDIADKQHRGSQNGMYQSIIAIAMTVAPVLGGLVADYYGYGEVFQVAAIIMVSMLISLAIYDKVLFPTEVRKNQRKKSVFRRKELNPFIDIKDFLRVAQLRTIGLLGMLVNVVIPFFTVVLPLIVIEQYGFTNAQLSLLILARGLSHIFQYPIGEFIDTFGKKTALFTGLSIYAAGFMLLTLTQSLFVLIAIMFVQGLGAGLWNMSIVSTLSTIAEEKNMEGKVMGSYASLSRISMTISFAFSGILVALLGVHLLLVYAGIIVFALLLFYKPLQKILATS